MATFDIALANGEIDIELVSFVVKGREMPRWMLDLAQDTFEESGVLRSDEVLEVTRRLERLDVQNDRVVITAATP